VPRVEDANNILDKYKELKFNVSKTKTSITFGVNLRTEFLWVATLTDFGSKRSIQ